MGFIDLIVGIVLGALAFGLVIWIVGKLGLGIAVSGFGPAFIAAIVIAIVTWVVMWLLGLLGFTIGTGFWGAIVALVVSAVILMFSGRLFKGLTVKGFTGAIVAAIAIAVVTWLINWVLGLFF